MVDHKSDFQIESYSDPQDKASDRSIFGLSSAGLFATIFGIVCGAPSIADAQTASNIGEAIENFLSNLTGSFPNALLSAFFILGVYLVVAGIRAIIYAAQNDSPGTSKWSGVYMILGGSALSMLISIVDSDVYTFLGGLTHYNGNYPTVGSPNDCAGDSGTSTVLGCVLQNIGTNVVPVAVESLFIGCYLGAIVIFGTTIYQLSVSRQRQAEAPKNWQLKIVGSAMLANIPGVFQILADTLGLQSVVTLSGYQGVSGGTASSLLTYTPSTDSTALSEFSGTITWVFVILSCFGIFYGVQGIFMLMNSDQHRDSKTKAMIHILAGACLANIKSVVVWITATLGFNIIS